MGTENYRRLFTEDPLFWKALAVTLEYAVLSVPLGIAASLAIAMLLNQKVRGIPLFRALFYMPSLVPSVAMAIVWQWVFNANHGILNQVLGAAGLGKPQWLQDAKWTIPAFVIMSLSGAGGARMIIFLAGLQAIPSSYYEAAQIDGADGWSQFRHITLPMLSPVTFFNLTLGVIGSFQYFTQAFVMTNGGPNNASLFYALSIFRNAFEYFKFGKASALAWILFAIVLAITLAQFGASRRWVYYEGETR
ncbi:MAG TPA: sugar ABC transporter permease [Fimbriimonas sp.]|nr:sugar ABC transporter permease [Fimbriimonas sp.]